MDRKEQLYEGKAKRIFATTDPDIVLVSFKDDAAAFGGEKKGSVAGKGAINNRCSNHLFKMLERNGIRTHYVEEISSTDTYVKKAEMIPIEVNVRNIAAGSLSKRLGLEEGLTLKSPILEFCYKSDALGDPLINDYHIYALSFASEKELNKIKAMSLTVNDILRNYLKDINIDLIDFKLEFGRYKNDIILVDEISPDTCRFWDSLTREKLDKDRFRGDISDAEEAYKEVMKRLLSEQIQ